MRPASKLRRQVGSGRASKWARVAEVAEPELASHRERAALAMLIGSSERKIGGFA